MNTDEHPAGRNAATEQGGQDECGSDLEKAAAAVERDAADVREIAGELRAAEEKLDRDEERLKDAEGCNTQKVEVKVDGTPKWVVAGTYPVATFKAMVGVAADKELDILENGAFRPLDDNGKVTVEACDVFISHAKTGGSS